MEMYRKDRVRCLKGAANLREHRLNGKTKARRVVATCCNTPIFLDFTDGHWIDLYGLLWPEDSLPPLQMRTMVGDMEAPANTLRMMRPTTRPIRPGFSCD